MEIWIRRDGKEYGPCTLEQVKESVDNGGVTLEDEAWFDGCEDYLTVGDIPHFFPRKIAHQEPGRKENPIAIQTSVEVKLMIKVRFYVGTEKVVSWMNCTLWVHQSNCLL